MLRMRRRRARRAIHLARLTGFTERGKRSHLPRCHFQKFGLLGPMHHMSGAMRLSAANSECDALANQCSAGTIICPGSFNGVAVKPNYRQSPCPTATIRRCSGSDEVLRAESRFRAAGRASQDILRVFERKQKFELDKLSRNPGLHIDFNRNISRTW
jgi:hypothetical protein